MRPIRLVLEGFTSFRQRSELCFAGLDLFAITGPTGAGKSSLLDAITYALFGQTARLGKAGAARELVSQGTANVSVWLEFQAGSDTYQVFRGMRGNTPKGQLEKKAPDGTWVSETSSLREITTRIEQIVGLNFEGFTRAVILPQGRFDELLRGDSKQRRAVLKDLLGLEVFEKMMQQANTKAQNFVNQASHLESLIHKDVSPELCKQLENSIGELQAKESHAKELLSKLNQGQEIAEELSAHRVTAKHQRAELEKAEEESRRLNRQLTVAEEQREQHQRAMQTISSSISALAYQPEEHLRIAQLLPRIQGLANLRNQIAELKKEHADCDQQLRVKAADLEQANARLDEASRHVEEEEARLTNARSNLEAAFNRYGSPQVVRNLAGQWKKSLEDASQSSALQAELQELQTQFSRREHVILELNRKMQEAEQAQNAAENLLEHLRLENRAMDLRQSLHAGEPCPVCEQIVTAVPELAMTADLEAAKQAVKEAQGSCQKARDEARRAPDRFATLEKQIGYSTEKLERLQLARADTEERVRRILCTDPGPAPEQQLEDLAGSIEQMQSQIRTLESQAKVTNRTQAEARESADAARLKCERLRERTHGLEQQIEVSENQGAEVARQLGDVPELAAVNAKLLELEKAKKHRDSLENALEQARMELVKAEADSANASRRLRDLTQEIVRTNDLLQKSAEEIRKAETRLQKSIAPVRLSSGQEVSELKNEISKTRELLQNLAVKRREQELQLQTTREKLNKNEELKALRNQLNHSAAVYRELGMLLSANRFQDYMLQSSYRLLAREGSRYFEELTAGRYSFHSQQDEFVVRDRSNGDEERSVSTLSGGESFLASLSLALALAESIMELSGERGPVGLESLFLDEGFSTLDAETLAKVADALPALQKKGRLIGIITHVQSLAEELPARIEIEKGPMGSRIVQPYTDQTAAAAANG